MKIRMPKRYRGAPLVFVFDALIWIVLAIATFTALLGLWSFAHGEDVAPSFNTLWASRGPIGGDVPSIDAGCGVAQVSERLGLAPIKDGKSTTLVFVCDSDRYDGWALINRLLDKLDRASVAPVKAEDEPSPRRRYRNRKYRR